MQESPVHVSRRRLLKTAAKASALVAAPMFVPSTVLGKDGAVAASDRIVLGCIGIGGRGSYVLQCFLQEPDVQAVAIAEVKAARRDAVKKTIDAKNGNADCKTYQDLREMLDRKDIDAVLIATGPNWHGAASMLAARYGKDVYCEKPCTKTISESFALADTFRRTGRVFQAGTQRRSLPNFIYAMDMARKGGLGKLHTVHAHPMGLATGMTGWLPPEPEPAKNEVDWDLYLGPTAWRPFNQAFLRGGAFEKGGGFTGGGCLEWGSHCVDLCQHANNADETACVEYEPVNKQLHARYANGVKLVIRDDGWLNSGSCPVKFEGEKGWIETGDSGDLFAEPLSLVAGRRQKIAGYPANFHVRDFLNCVKTRARTRANADFACWSHITCNAANIALLLDRKIQFDPKKGEFINDEEANRMRSEALREPWRI